MTFALRFLFHGSLIAFAFVFMARTAFSDSQEDLACINNREGVLLAQRGDMGGSTKAFERAVQANPLDDTARSNLATAYNNLGVFLCRQGKFVDALERFEAARGQKPEDLQVRLNLLSALVSMRDVERVNREARSILALRPDDPKTILKVATAYQRIEDSESARNLLERIIAAHPENSEALTSLGRMYYQQGNFSEARFYLERSMENTHLNASTSELLKRIGREEGVETRFERERSVHFQITFEDQISGDWMKDLLDLFEEGYNRIGDALGYYPAQRVQIIVYSPADFRRVSTMPTWAGGLYDGKIRLPVPPAVSEPSQLKGAVFHEYCHHVVHTLSDGRCPAWLNEGLAQFFEGLDAERAKKLLLSKGLNHLPPLAELEDSFSRAKSRSEAELFYAQSLWAVSQLLEERGMPSIQGVLTALAQRQTLDEALSAGIGQNRENLDIRLKESLE